MVLTQCLDMFKTFAGGGTFHKEFAELGPVGWE